MKSNRIMTIVFILGLMMGASGAAGGQELDLKDYDVLIVKNLEVPPGSPAPESAGPLAAEKVVYQVKRYSEKYGLFEAIAKEGTRGEKEAPANKKVLLLRGEVKEYSRPSVGRRIGRSFVPGGGFTGTAAFAARYQFVDKETGKVIHETDLRTTSIGAEDTVEYAMDRNGEAMAKLLLKWKGK